MDGSGSALFPYAIFVRKFGVQKFRTFNITLQDAQRRELAYTMIRVHGSIHFSGLDLCWSHHQVLLY